MNADTFLQIGIIAGSIVLMIFCVVLARRLRRLNDLETGLGGAIAVMAAEVDRLERSIRSARQEALTASENLAEQVTRAQAERAKWDLHMKMRQVVAPIEEPRPVAGKLRKRRAAVDA